MLLFRIPFFGRADDRPTQHEDRRAQFGRHRFAVEAASAGRLQKGPKLHKDSDLPHPSMATAALAEVTPRTSRRLTGTTHKLVASAATFFVLAFAVATTGDFCIEVVLRANSLIGVRMFTDKFDNLDGPCFVHAVEFGRLRMEASFGSWSPSIGAVEYANVAKGGKSIPALTSPLYSPPIRLDLTRMDKTFWKSFGPRPIIHSPEMALSGGTSPGQCWAFAGHTGQLGIQLPELIRVTSFTIEHTGNSSLTESAPRNIVLWGLVPKDSNDVSLNSTHTYRATSPIEPQFGNLHNGIPLASVIFDAVEGQLRQTFPVRCRERRRPFNGLLAQFVGNWGHPDFTCLYRFEINGEGIGHTP
ncbi:hypothetical protein EDB85DRAFT_2120231 [Lactarius pseudohatsudake]|nr:hypothetical protein EDB85DRAFT_2120231 [Lactarius pseudohatsudake]